MPAIYALPKCKPCLIKARTGKCTLGRRCWYAHSHSLSLKELKRQCACKSEDTYGFCYRRRTCHWIHKSERTSFPAAGQQIDQVPLDYDMQARLTQFEAQMAEAHNAVQANKLGFALLTYEILLAKCADLPTRIAILSGKANANSKLCIVREGPHVQRSLRDCITILDDLKSLGHLKPSLLHARNLMELERLPEAIQWCNAVMSQATSVLEERGPVDLVNTVLKRLKYFCQEDKTFGQAASSRKGIDDSVLKNSVELIKARELFTTAMYQRPISYHSIGLGEVNTWLTLPCCVAKSRSITETFTTSMESAPTASNPLK